jgi:hypothetical protein
MEVLLAKAFKSLLARRGARHNNSPVRLYKPIHGVPRLSDIDQPNLTMPGRPESCYDIGVGGGIWGKTISRQ